MKKIILLFATISIACSLGHQLKGGYIDHRKFHPRNGIRLHNKIGKTIL
ncbi:hypothetical protein [Peribacillus muralis]|nr:hypothetical protein [Peribacillus muralis]